MVFALLSPAKTLTFDPVPEALASHVTAMPHFQSDAVKLAKELQTYDITALSKLMNLSLKLSALNVARFHDFKAKPSAKTTQAPAILAYRGDVYQGFDVDTLTPAQIQFAHQHVGIITGLYGVLQPLDPIQPYRLEMSTPLPVGKAKNLYDYWGKRITEHVNNLAKQAKAKAVIGLASQEYLKAIQTADLNVPFINCDFKEKKNGKTTTVALFAKKARGMMARYIVTEKITKPDNLKTFTDGGYAFDAELSTDTHFIFVR
jgi:cytoplasmic iron level regulating protein YaaA (DUF328/UPF0246 family)